MKNVNDYIKLYTDVVDLDLCKEMIDYNFDYEKSTYSTHDSGKVVKLERVASVDCWIRERYKFYTRLKETYQSVINYVINICGFYYFPYIILHIKIKVPVY